MVSSGSAVQDDAHVAEDGPLRTCIVTRSQLPPEALIRFVAAPDGSIVPDLARRLPGRGVWVTATREAVAATVAGREFARSLKRQVKVPADLAERVEALLAKRLAEAVSLANKAGLVIAGFTKVDAAIAAGDVAALLHGAGAAADGRDKLDRKLAAVSAGKGGTPPIIDLMTIDELSLAIGRGNVVHAALREGGAARRVIDEAGRMWRYRSGAR
jgi:hypothetical protein